MIVDSSAILAILYREPEAERFETAIASAPDCRMPVANGLEASIAVEGRGGAAAGYALAETAGEPPLFKGGDFAQTDIEAA